TARTIFSLILFLLFSALLTIDIYISLHVYEDTASLNLRDLLERLRIVPRVACTIVLTATVAAIPHSLFRHSLITERNYLLTEGRISIAESTLLYVLTAGLIVSWPWAVYVILNFFFWPYVMIDQGASSIMALKYAATIIRGEKVQLLIILT